MPLDLLDRLIDEASRKAIDAGLVPLVGKARIDNPFTGIKNRGRLLTVCGRCADVCSNQAIRVSLSDPEFLEKSYRRIREYVKFD